MFMSCQKNTIYSNDENANDKKYYGQNLAGNHEFWKNFKGIGFSISSLGIFSSRGRLQEGLNHVINNNYNMIRTWGTGEYEKFILNEIKSNNLDIKVQLGVWIDEHKGFRAKIDSALVIADIYPNAILGLSLGNEMFADFANSSITVGEVIEHVEYLRFKSNVPVTYNFAEQSFYQDNFLSQNVKQLLDSLDYINIHLYGNHHTMRNSGNWTPLKQLETLKNSEKSFFNILKKINVVDKPVILGETGWQSNGYNPEITNVYRMEEFYIMINNYIYNDDNNFGSMFYFNLTDESWKSNPNNFDQNDDNWGIYFEGNNERIGDKKFFYTKINDIIK